MRRLPYIALVALLLVLPARAEDKPVEQKAEEKKAPATLAHIRLSGSLDEGPVSDDPIFGSLSEDKLLHIDGGRRDFQPAQLLASGKATFSSY